MVRPFFPACLARLLRFRQEYLTKTRPSRTRPLLELLEDRVVPTTDVWAAGASGAWSDATKWSLGRPPVSQDAVVSPGAGQTVTHASGTDTVANLTSDGSLVDSGGSLTVTGSLSGTVNVAGAELDLTGASTNTGTLTLNLSGAAAVVLAGSFDNTGGTITVTGYGTLLVRGTLKGGTLNLQGSTSLAGEFGTLDGVQVNGAVAEAGGYYLKVKNGLNLNGAVTLGTAAGSDYGSLVFVDSQSLTGAATVNFANTNGHNSLLIASSTATVVPTLTLGAGVTVQGQGGTVGYLSDLAIPGPTGAALTNDYRANLVNNGTIDANYSAGSGGFLLVNANWTNNSVFEATAGGNFTLTGGGTWASSSPFALSGSSSVYLDGVLSAPTNGLEFLGQGTVYPLGNGTLPYNVGLMNGATVVGQDSLSYTGAYTTVGNWLKQFQYTADPMAAAYGAIRSAHGPAGYAGQTPVYLVDLYRANVAAAGALRAGLPGSLTMGRAWLEWQLGAPGANQSGVNFQAGQDGVLHGMNYLYDAAGGYHGVVAADADDSYAALFCYFTWQYVAAGGDTSPLVSQGVKGQFEAAANVILGLQDPATGLTYAKSTYRIEYLEDNSEVYAGLTAMAHLEATVFNDPQAARRYSTAASQVANGINTSLFDTASGLYRYAVGSPAGPTYLNPWYPNSVSLVWPELYGVAGETDTQVHAQLANIDEYWNGSSATRPNWGDSVVDGAGGTWPSVGLAALSGADVEQGRVHTEWVLGQLFPPGSTANGTITANGLNTVDDAGFLLLSLAAINSRTPTSSVTALPAYSPGSFTVSWGGSDYLGGPGIASYSVYYSEDGGAYQPLLINTTQTSTTFMGADGHSYGFYSVATDMGGTTQPTPASAQATTRVDAAPPTGTVAPLPALTTTPTFTVAWSGSDGSGSGVANYDVYSSADGGAFALWLSQTTATSASFAGSVGHSYGFYVRARDVLGNVEPAPAGAQATTTVAALALSHNSATEFRPTGTVVGTLSVGGTATYTYTLVSGTGGDDDASFTIQGNQLVTADAFNFAAKSAYTVRVRATDANSDFVEQAFALTVTDDPSVALDGRTLTVTGSSGSDTFSFTPGAVQDTLTRDGVVLAADTASLDTVAFQGGGGSDRADLNAGSGAATASLTPTGGTLTGSGYRVTLSGVATIVVNGNAGDTAYLYDSAGNDVFVSAPTYAYLRGTGFFNQVDGFGVASAYSTGGSDSAYLSGGAGSNVFVGTPTYAHLNGAGYFDQVNGFKSAVATSMGGTDTAFLYAATNNGSFVGTPTYAALSGSGYYNQAGGFKTVFGFASGAGETASLSGSAGNDTFIGTPTYAILSGMGFLNQANGFGVVTGSSGGGKDTAYLYDSAGNDVFVGTPTYAYLRGTGFFNQVNGFGVVSAFSTGGADTAYLYDGPGNDTFIGTPTYAYLTGAGFFNQANGFKTIDAYSTGGSDTADLFDSPGNDLFQGSGSSGVLSGTSYTLQELAFALVRIHSTQGGTDTARLSAHNYLFQEIGPWK